MDAECNTKALLCDEAGEVEKGKEEEEEGKKKRKKKKIKK